MRTHAKEIFKAYDIRGIVGKTLTLDTAYAIGLAFGATALERNVRAVCVGRDGRLSGPDLVEALTRGLRAAGVDVIDVGRVTTPMLYFSTYELRTLSGIMVTGSHNPPEYNGFKMMLAGDTLAGEAIQQLYQRIITPGLPENGTGSCRHETITEAYFARILGDIKLTRPLNIVVDCGNGVAGAFAPVLYRRLDCRVRELFCEVDGRFPNHHPDPSQPKNLQDLIHALASTDAEIGLAFDGDGDRLGVVTKDGQIIYPDRQMMLFAGDVLSRNAHAKIIYDVKSTRLLAPWIREMGGEPIMSRTGHSFIKAKIKESGALLGGEMSGHIFFKERWYGFDDGLYAGARLLEILSQVDDPNALLNNLPNALSTPELTVTLPEGEHYALVTRLQAHADFSGASEVITLDGLRVEYPDGFGLVRASNTTPCIVLRFEADNEQALGRIQDDFRRALRAETSVELPF